LISLKKTFLLKGKKNIYFNNHSDSTKRQRKYSKSKMNDISMYNADNNLASFPSDGGKPFEIKTSRKRIEFAPLQGIKFIFI